MLAAKDLGYTTIGLAGGVSANSGVREKLQKACDKRGYKLYMPEFKCRLSLTAITSFASAVRIMT